MQDKNLRGLVLTCLCQCFHSYLGRIGPTARLSEINAYLMKHTKPLLQNLRKNNFQQPDQHVSPASLNLSLHTSFVLSTHITLQKTDLAAGQCNYPAYKCHSGCQLPQASIVGCRLDRGLKIMKVTQARFIKRTKCLKIRIIEIRIDIHPAGCSETDLHKDLRKSTRVRHRHPLARAAAGHD